MESYYLMDLVSRWDGGGFRELGTSAACTGVCLRLVPPHCQLQDGLDGSA